jgi:hypothetical protein
MRAAIVGTGQPPPAEHALSWPSPLDYQAVECWL